MGTCLLSGWSRNLSEGKNWMRDYIIRRLLGLIPILLGISAGLTALLPLYRPLIKRINTSVAVEGNEDMAVIDISGEDT